MNDFRRKLAAPYRSDCESLEEHARLAQALPRQIAPSLQRVPAMIETAERQTIPRWQARIDALQRRMTPLDLRQLRATIEQLSKVNRLTWSTPLALRIRAVNFAYRAAIATVILVELAIVLVLVYWFIRLIWYLA